MKCQVLIAEDEKLLADMLREIFEDYGCEVVSFATADAAYDYLQGPATDWIYFSPMSKCLER